MGVDLVRRDEEVVELFSIDGFQIGHGDFVAAGRADVFRRSGPDVHFLTAVAERIASEEVLRFARGALHARALTGDEAEAFLPELFGNDRLDRVVDPLAFGLHGPVFPTIVRAGVVRAVQALGRWIFEKPGHGRVGKQRAVSGPVAPLVQNARDRLFASMFEEQLVKQYAHRCFGRIGFELLVAPAIAERCRAADGFAELGADRDRRLDAFRDLLALPLGHCSDHCEKQPACRRTRVDLFLERNEVRITRSKNLGELQKLFRIARETREFRKHEAGDRPLAQVREHPLCFRMPHNRFAADGFKPIHLDDVPALQFRIRASALLVVLRAFPARLVLGRDPYPNAYALGLVSHASCGHGVLPQSVILCFAASVPSASASSLTQRAGRRR